MNCECIFQRDSTSALEHETPHQNSPRSWFLHFAGIFFSRIVSDHRGEKTLASDAPSHWLHCVRIKESVWQAGEGFARMVDFESRHIDVALLIIVVSKAIAPSIRTYAIPEKAKREI